MGIVFSYSPSQNCILFFFSSYVLAHMYSFHFQFLTGAIFVVVIFVHALLYQSIITRQVFNLVSVCWFIDVSGLNFLLTLPWMLLKILGILRFCPCEMLEYLVGMEVWILGILNFLPQSTISYQSWSNKLERGKMHSTHWIPNFLLQTRRGLDNYPFYLDKSPEHSWKVLIFATTWLQVQVMAPFMGKNI